MFKIKLFVFLTIIYLVESQERDHTRTRNLQVHQRRNERSFRNTPQNGQENDSNILNKILDKISVLNVLGEQQLKKIEALENKLSISHEKTDSIQSEIRELSRRIQNLDWITSKSEGTLDKFRSELASIRDNMQNDNPIQQQSKSSYDVSQKLDALAVFLTSARNSIQKVEREIHRVGRNLSTIITTTSDISFNQKDIPTKQFISSAIQELRTQPNYAIAQSQINTKNSDSNSNKKSNERDYPSSCGEINSYKSGIQKLQVGELSPFFAYCNLEEQGGKWTVIQSRLDGTVSFYRNWNEYKNGFGNLGGEFWIGLEKLYEITRSKLHELIIIMEDFEGQSKYVKYSSFAIGSEEENYALILLSGYEGTGGDSLTYHAGQKFSTFDSDNDSWAEGNCALAHTGAWWYNACDMSNLNGKYLGEDVPAEMAYQGVYWNKFGGQQHSLKSVKMMIRPVE